MNRRQILKAALLTPFLGLFKSRKSGASTGLTLDKLKECRDELEKNSLKPDENGMISLTSGTSGGNYACWRFLDEEPETYSFTCFSCGKKLPNLDSIKDNIGIRSTCCNNTYTFVKWGKSTGQ